MMMKEQTNGEALERLAPAAVPATLLDSAPAVEKVVAFVRAVRTVADRVMQEGIHYGRVPGTDKRSLWQPGAEVLGVAFRCAPTFEVECDGPDEDGHYSFTAVCRIVHQDSGKLVAEGVGECSTGEQKYAWRRALDREEFERTFEGRRRIKRKRSKQGAYDEEQVRTDPNDLRNTCRKMACKRAHVGATRAAFAASDTFSDGLEELVEAGVELNGESAPSRPAPAEPKATAPPPRRPAPPAVASSAPPANGGQASIDTDTFDHDRAEIVGASIPDEAWDEVRGLLNDRGPVTEGQVKRLFARAREHGWGFDDVRNVVGHNLGLAIEEVPKVSCYDKVVLIFDSFQPAV